MRRNRNYLVLLAAVGMAGCSLPRPGIPITPIPMTRSLVVQDVTLSKKQPIAQLGQYSVQLVEIAEDGTTRIRVVQTDKILSARPGQCFVSYEFGEKGLQLLSASKSSGVAKMTAIGCVSE